MTIQVDVRPKGIESALARGSFDKSYTELQNAGYQIISLAENAELRISQGKDSTVARNGNWVREGALYVPAEGNFLVRNSPLLANAKEATQAQREGKDFYVTAEQVERAMNDSVALPRKYNEIPTNRFGEDELTVFAFGGSERAQLYGDFLKGAGIEKMPIYVADENYVSEQKNPFARQMWFSGLDCGSNLYGGGRGLHVGSGVRGVRPVSGEASAQKISVPNSELYTPAQIRKALNTAGITGGVEKLVFERLNN